MHVVFVFLGTNDQAAKSEEKQERFSIIRTSNLLSHLSRDMHFNLKTVVQY
jgi:hypothetical protein